MECRTKRIGFTRQISNSGTEVERKRATFQKRSSVNKQASTQTEQNDDFFLSEESMSSNEDQNTNTHTLSNSKTQHNYEEQDESYEPQLVIPVKLNQISFDQSHNTNIISNNNLTLNATGTSQRNNRQRRYKKFSKRRKSLPSQGSSNEEPHVVTLIPRGPLICSNSENNWLPEKFSNSSIVNSSISCDYDTNSIISINSHINNKLNSNKINSSDDNKNNCININKTNINLIASNTTSTSNLSITPSISTIPDSTNINYPGLTIDIPPSSSPKTKIITKTKSKNSSSIAYRNPIQIPSTVNYDVNIIKTTVYNGYNSKVFDSNVPNMNRNKAYCSKIESDFYLNDMFDDYQLDDEIIGTGSYSSNEDETNEIILKLKEAEKVLKINKF